MFGLFSAVRMRGAMVGLTAASVAAFALAARPTEAATPRTAGLSAAPGTLILAKPVSASALPAGTTVYLVKYWSKSFPANKPVQVTGAVMIPSGTPPPDGWPVVSWAHGTDGMNGKCAASKLPGANLPSINKLLGKGWVVVATDYAGEGNPALAPTTKGLHPYFVGTNSGRNAIDIVRAARQLDAAHASSHYVVSGHSEGGQAAMFALEIAARYAPELHLDGVVEQAVGSQYVERAAAVSTSSIWPLQFMIVGGFRAAYGKAADLSQVLTPTGIKLLPVLGKECIKSVYAAAEKAGGYKQVFKSTKIPAAWQTLLNQNDPFRFKVASGAPLLMIQGDQDQDSPATYSAALAKHLCAVHQDLERWTYPGLDHTGILVHSGTFNDVDQWIADRFAGGPNPDPYVPIGNGNETVGTTICS